MHNRRTRHFAPPDTAIALKLGYLSVYAQLLWHRIHTDATDDQGRFIADPRSLKVVCVPYVDEIDVDRVWDAMLELVTIEFVVVYPSGSDMFGQVIHWWSYQTGSMAYPSSYPAPPGWVDSHCFNVRHGKTTVRKKINWPPEHDYGVTYLSKCPEALRLGVLQERYGNVTPIKADQSGSDQIGADQTGAGTSDETLRNGHVTVT